MCRGRTTDLRVEAGFFLARYSNQRTQTLRRHHLAPSRKRSRVMVDQSNIANINVLYRELQQVKRALAAIAAGKRITEMTIGDVDEGVAISTVDMPTPPQMYTEISNLLAQRQTAIAQQLANYGVTGVS